MAVAQRVGIPEDGKPLQSLDFPGTQIEMPAASARHCAPAGSLRALSCRELRPVLGEGDESTKAELDTLFQKAITDRPLKLVAFLSTDAPDVPEGPGDRTLRTLRDVLAYMDIEAELWRKRYSWEVAATRQ